MQETASFPTGERRLIGRFLIYFLTLATLETLLAITFLFIFIQQDDAVQHHQKAVDNNSMFLARALEESGLENILPWKEPENAIYKLNFQKSQEVLFRFSRNTKIRTRVISPEREFIADNRFYYNDMDFIPADLDETLIPPPLYERLADRLLFFLVGLSMEKRSYAFPETESLLNDANQLDEVQLAFRGENANRIRILEDGRLLITSASPILVEREGVIGAVLSSDNMFSVSPARRGLLFRVIEILCYFIAASVFLSELLVWGVYRPLGSLKKTASKISRFPSNAGIGFGKGTRLDRKVSGLSSALQMMVDGFRTRIEAMDRFSSDVSHEIRRPLTSLRSAVETMSRLESEAEKEELMKIVLSDSNRLDRLISDISDFSRLGVELDSEEIEKVDLGKLIPQVCQNIESSHKECTIRFSASDGDGWMIEAHPDRIVQVLENILTNALSFSPPDSLTRVSLKRKNKMLWITVDDEGPGIAEGNLDSVFNRFFSNRPQDHKDFHSGLGLAISRQIIEAHGGRLWAENRYSDDGEVAGARFIIELAPEG